MNKDIIVLLLQKDIKELSLLTDGFEKMNEFPEPILRLARNKAENVVDKLNELSVLYSEESEIIDYGSFESENDRQDEMTEEEAFEDYEKNNFDVPLDSHMESPVNPYEIEDGEPEVSITERDSEPTEGFDKKVEVEFESIDAENDINEQGADFVVIDEPTIEGEEDVQLTSSEDELQEVVVSDTQQTTGKKQTTSVFKDTLTVEDKSLTANLESQKIHDIRQAINIGDRFRFQRELFGGNGEVLNKTISYLNQLANFSEAETFLKSKFGWEDNNEHAKEFLQIVKRRYL
ncbi:MAG: hypothetical protein GX361_07935 [Bacteroidales bacterium]|nr:hypothetical protein [Bacteroidales bacterium]